MCEDLVPVLITENAWSLVAQPTYMKKTDVIVHFLWCTSFAFYFRSVLPNVVIYLCNWHVKRSWLKNLVIKVKDVEVKANMWRDLATMMHGSGNASLLPANAWIDQEVQVFRLKYAGETAFLNYFEKEWGNEKLGKQL